MIEAHLSPSGRQLQLHLGDHRGEMTWRDLNDRLAVRLRGVSPVAFLIVAPRMMRAREFADMFAALPAVRAVLPGIQRVAIVSDTPAAEWLGQASVLFESIELRSFLLAERRRAERWLDAVPEKAAAEGAAAAGVRSPGGGATEEGAVFGDGVYQIEEPPEGDSDIDDWFVKP